MKIVDLIALGLKNFISDNRKIINIILLTMCFILVLISISYSAAIQDYWNNSVKKLVDFRTYYVYYDTNKYSESEAITKLKTTEHVVDVATSASYLISMKANDYISDNTDGSIFLVGTSKDGIRTIIGNDFNDDINNTIICAQQFYPQIEEQLSDYKTEKIIDISNQVGKNMNLSFLGDSSSIEQMKLLGVYDAREYFTEGNICYAYFSTVEKLNMKYQEDVFNDEDSQYPLVMVLDSIDSKDGVLNQIKNDGFSFDRGMLTINTEIGNEITKITTIGAFVIILFTLFINLLFVLKDFEDKKDYYALLKSYGYLSKEIVAIKYISYLITGLLSFLISIPFTIIIINIIKKYYFITKLMYINIDFSIKINAILISLIICILLPLILCIIFNHKIKKTNIIEELK
jgi:ABC-type antimicrobial peptide transport system permease subunit